MANNSKPKKVSTTEKELKEKFEKSNFSTAVLMPEDLPEILKTSIAPVEEQQPFISANNSFSTANPAHVVFTPSTNEFLPESGNIHNLSPTGNLVEQPTQQSLPQITFEQQQLVRFKQDLLQYQKTSLPKFLQAHNISADQFGLSVLNYLREDNAIFKAFIANPQSMFASIFAAAEVGLIPTKRSGEFYFIPRNLKQPNGSYKITICPQIGYVGLVKILLRSDKILHVNATVVYECDEFEVTYGINPSLIHKPNLEGDRSANKIKYVYAYVNFKNGMNSFHVMTRREIEAIKALQKDQNHLYFNDKIGINRWMEKKLALVQLSKLIPKDYYHTASMAIINKIDGGGSVSMDEDNNLIFHDNPENTFFK